MIELIAEYWKPFLFSDGYSLTGLAMTLWLLVASIVMGFFLSLPLAIMRTSRWGLLRWPVQLFTYVFRGTPLYIQLLICYSGIYGIAVVRSQPLLEAFFRDAMNCTLLAFTLNTCAYTVEIFAGAILPSALRRALPYYSNEVILMLHATSVAFTATIPDILKIARDANAATFMTFQAFGIAGLLYLALSFGLVAAFRLAEKRWLSFLGPTH
jgi:histidine transport system permease protein